MVLTGHGQERPDARETGPLPEEFGSDGTPPPTHHSGPLPPTAEPTLSPDLTEYGSETVGPTGAPPYPRGRGTGYRALRSRSRLTVGEVDRRTARRRGSTGSTSLSGNGTDGGRATSPTNRRATRGTGTSTASSQGRGTPSPDGVRTRNTTPLTGRRGRRWGLYEGNEVGMWGPQRGTPGPGKSPSTPWTDETVPGSSKTRGRHTSGPADYPGYWLRRTTEVLPPPCSLSWLQL